MKLVADNSKKNLPPRWPTYDSYVSAYPASAFKFVDKTKPNRFAARYRAAKCLKQIEFDYLSSATAEGYTVLCKTMLTYSAFEYFLEATGMKDPKSKSLLSSKEKIEIVQGVRRLDTNASFCAWLHSHTRSRTRAELELHLNGGTGNPLEIAAAIRHTFAHGVLTPSPKEVPNESITKVSKYMTAVLFKVMDREIESRVKDFI
jgi:hypothetical protein